MDQLPDTPTITSRVKDLTKHVKPYGKINGDSTQEFSFLNFTKSFRLYIYIPIIVLVVLLFWRPKFIMYSQQRQSENIVEKISWKKLGILWVILSVLLNGALFWFRRQKHKG